MKSYLTYDDIQLVPAYSEIESRKSIKLNTMVSRRYGLCVPVIASPMDTVCGFDMACKLMQMGGLGVIHRFMSIEEQCKIIGRFKSYTYESTVDEYIIEKWSTMYDDLHPEFPYIPIAAAIGVQIDDTRRAKELVKSGANILIIDVAHGHHKNVIDMVKWCKDQDELYHVDIIAGNIATADAAIDLENAGVDGLRVGVGGGSLCTTRIKTGFGVPNVTCLEEIVSVATVPIMADGGIRNSGDIAKALAIGASTVMLGSLLAGTRESPGDIIKTKNGLYKRYRGAASLESKITNGKDIRNIEGESTIIPYKGGVNYIMDEILDDIKSSVSYAGCNNLKNFNPKYILVSNAGITEAKPHLL
jgi:IMP dehydrogenase